MKRLMYALYTVMAVISYLVRQSFLPNPFECFGGVAFIINLIAEPFIHLFARGLVSLVYRKGECPPLGSFLYLLAYSAIVGVLALMGIFAFAWWWVLIIVVVTIAVCVLLAKLRRWLDGTTW